MSDCLTAGKSSSVRVPCPYKLSVRQHLGTSAVLSVRHPLGTYSVLCSAATDTQKKDYAVSNCPTAGKSSSVRVVLEGTEDEEYPILCQASAQIECPTVECK